MTALPEVLEKLERATPGPWHYSERGFSTKPTPMVYATGQDLNYIAMCRDFGNEGPTLNEENAQAIVAAVNWLREHGDRLRDMEVAVAQAVEFAEYVERQAKGAMVEAAKRFLSAPYAAELAERLKHGPALLRDAGDAARYRWLRDSTDSRAFIACYFQEDANDVRQITGAISDAAIDSAMQQGGGG